MSNFDDFKNYMNKIEADTDLKENTKKYVRDALSDRMQRENLKDSRNNQIKSIFARRILATACSVAAIAILSIGSYAYYVTPVNYISLDINPSVELGVNAFDTVVSIEGLNDDGKNLIKGKELTNMTVEETISALVMEAAEQNYINEDGSTVIAVTAESDNKKDIAGLQHDCVKGINAALDSKNINAIIYTDNTNLDTRDEAEDLNISPGKLNLINYLQALDPSITVDQYRESQISEIISDANDLLTDSDATNNQLVKSEDTTNEILDTAEQLQQALDQTSGEQDQNQNNQLYDDSSSENPDNQENNQTDDKPSS